jgi:hypothetical protein
MVCRVGSVGLNYCDGGGKKQEPESRLETQKDIFVNFFPERAAGEDGWVMANRFRIALY